MNGTLDNEQEAEIEAISKVFKGQSPGEIYINLLRNDLKYPKWDYDDIIKESFKNYTRDIEKALDLFKKNKKPKIKKFFIKYIKENSKNYRFFVFSKESVESVKKRLEEAGILQYIEKVYRLPKPSLDSLRKILEDNNLKVGDIIFVGDDPLLDLLPAKILGMKTVLVNSFVDELWKEKN